MSSLYGGNVWGFTQFADDLRDEVGGKISIMGVYQSDFIVTAPSLPVILPKLVVLVHYYEIANTTMSDLNFKVTFPEAATEIPFPNIEQSIKREEFPKGEPDKRSDEGDPPFLSLRVPFVISPFPVLAEGPIKVRCYFNDGSVLKLGRLLLRLRKPTPDPTTSGPPASQSPPAA